MKNNTFQSYIIEEFVTVCPKTMQSYSFDELECVSCCEPLEVSAKIIIE
jgi:hypothetical protein